MVQLTFLTFLRYDQHFEQCTWHFKFPTPIFWMFFSVFWTFQREKYTFFKKSTVSNQDYFLLLFFNPSVVETSNYSCIRLKHFALPISISLNFFLSLRDRDLADTIITFHHQPLATTRIFLRTLELTFTQVWYIIGIVSSSPTHFHSEKIGLTRFINYLHCQFSGSLDFLY